MIVPPMPKTPPRNIIVSTERSLKRLREMCLVQSPAYAPYDVTVASTTSTEAIHVGQNEPNT